MSCTYEIQAIYRVSLKILESPGIGKKIPGLESPGKSVEVLESSGINFLNLQLCQHY
jgi:hypothetical protein